MSYSLPFYKVIFLVTFGLFAIQGNAYATPDLTKKLDHLMRGLLDKYEVPGGALTVSKNGEILYSKGFGYADIESRTRLSPKSLFRIASLSKPITAVAILQLIDQGKLSLDARVYSLLKRPILPPGQPLNEKIALITVEQLLNHSSGQTIYNEKGRITSPMQPPVSRRISQLYNSEHPPSFEHVIGYMAAQSLVNEPGEAYRYSNFGYALLGRVVEHVTGMDYETYVRKEILFPRGIENPRFGLSRREDKAIGEVTYYDIDDRKLVNSVFDAEDNDTYPYAGRHLQGWGAAGAWIASTEDLVKFVNHIDGTIGPRLLSGKMIEAMQARPSFAEPRSRFWYGLGWRIQMKKYGSHWYHNGSSNGGAAGLLLKSADGYVWAALFNRRLPKGRELYKEFNAGMWASVPH